MAYVNDSEQCPASCPWCEVYGTHDPEVIADVVRRQGQTMKDAAGGSEYRIGE